VNFFMSTWKGLGPESLEIRQNLVLRPTPEQFDIWNDAALAEGKRISDWALSGLDRLAAEHEVPIPASRFAPGRIVSALNETPAAPLQRKAK
jgi:hypothetical protein